MTPQEINQAIAKSIGWTNIDKYLGREPLPFTREFWGGTDDGLAEGEDTLGHEIKPLPNYHADLNAIHEAVSLLSPEQKHDYAVILAMRFWPNGWTNWACTFQVSETTAPQRCESFLRVKGLWK